jgi:2-polyprenyl-6-methoxyphenol hydroxylase-like FAD-dependent oxidoreductase
LVACDGGRSAVRKLIGAAFPGEEPSSAMVVADVVFEDAETLPKTWSGVRSRLRAQENGQIFALIPLEDGVYRILYGGDDKNWARRFQRVTEDEVRAAIHERYGAELSVHEVRYATRFTDASRQVERYRIGRVLLAGDAAHIHLPAGGQGLNLGVQDAFNLGWKLAAEVRGWAPASLLDSYHDERHPVGARVLQNTRAQGVLMGTGAAIDALRSVLSELLTLSDTNSYLAGMISGLDIEYPMGGPDHRWLGRRVPDVRLSTGRRLYELLRSGRALLVDACGKYAQAAADWTERVDYCPARGELSELQAALIRPDGHVCWIATDDSAHATLTAALHTWFGAPASSTRAQRSARPIVTSP